MISNSGHDENGRYSGGKAGDQGGEWQIQPWYNRPWNYVFRHPSSTVRECIAELAEEAARNNKVGYDQSQRTTFWKQLQKSDYHPANIKEPCEADCSAGVAAIVKAAGYLLRIPSLQDVSEDMYTGSERKALSAAGFQVLTDSKYLESDQYLMRGDILLYEGHHTAINLTDGVRQGWHWVKSDGVWYYQDGDGMNSYGWRAIPVTGGTDRYWYYFAADGAMQTGSIWIGDELYTLMDRGPLEGACCKSDDRGVQKPWKI